MSILVNATYERISVGSLLSSNRTSAWSLCGWAKLTGSSAGTGRNLFMSLQTHAVANWNSISDYGTFPGTLRLYDTYSYTDFSAGTPTDGEWHYYAMSCAGTSGANDLKAYVWNASGTLVASATATSVSGNEFDPAYFTFGGGPNYSDLVYAYWAYGRAWEGTALTQGEFEAELAATTPQKTGCFSAFGADSGTDVTGNARDWTLSSGVTTDSGVNPSFSSAVTITDASDENFYNGESITITGTGFGASQGTGVVKICPTDSVNDASGVSQTVTAWSDTSITITVVKSTLSWDTGLYLFVKNNAGTSNTAGRAVQLSPRVFIRETLIDLEATTLANETGLGALIWRVSPASQSNPNEALSSLTTNGSGVTAWQITRGSLAVNDPIWVAIFKDGSPARATMRKITPSYE